MPSLLDSLRAHLGRQGATPQPDPWPDRPAGRLIWVHAPQVPLTDEQTAALTTLPATVQDAGEGPCHLLLTPAGFSASKTPTSPGTDLAAALFNCAPPPEDANAIARFLAHWQPDWALWIGAGAPLAARALRDAGIPAAVFLPVRPREDRSIRALLSCFDQILTSDRQTAAALSTLDPAQPPDKVQAAGPLLPMPRPPAAAASDLDALASAFSGRPIWLAALPTRPEADALDAAHAASVARAHRLALILMARPGDSGFWSERLRASGWTVASRQGYALPDARTEVFIADGPEEAGLWLRLAPVTWLGGTLAPDPCPPGADAPGPGLSPRAAAALGSALISGPATGAHAATLAELSSAGALRHIADAPALGPAVTSLLSPEIAARQAAAGWRITSAGAPLMAALRRALLDALDRAPPPRT